MSQSPQDPVDQLSDQLSDHLAINSIAHGINGQWMYFPPSASLEEQLLILAGVQDYTLNGSATQVFSPAEMARTSASPDNTGAFNAKDAMSQHLAMLEDTELSSMMHTSLHIHDSKQATRTPPSSPPFAGYQGSYPPGSLEHLENMYTQALRQCTGPDDLSDGPLPECSDELAALSRFMVGQIWWMMADGELAEMVKAPKAHPLYPFWVIPELEEDPAGEVGGYQGGDEMDMDK